MECWKCHYNDQSDNKVSFKTTCDKCTAWQHCCNNCIFYSKNTICNLNNDEKYDPEKFNFCEDFKEITDKTKKENKNGKKGTFNKFEDLFK